MGYEVFLIKTKTNQEPLEKIHDPVPFPPRRELLARIQDRFPGCLDSSDPAWAYLIGPPQGQDPAIFPEPLFSMELNIGEDPIQCVMVVRPAGRDGMWAVGELCRLFQCRAFDGGDGPLDFEHPQGWLKEALEASQQAREGLADPCIKC